MPVRRTAESKPMKAIRKAAANLPEAETGAVCVNAAFKAGKKSFLFLGMHDETYNVRLKLNDSLAEANRLEAERPDNCQVGKHGWVKLVFPHSEQPPAELFDHWIKESYRNLVPKHLVELIDDHEETTKKRSTAKASGKKALGKKKTA